MKLRFFWIFAAPVEDLPNVPPLLPPTIPAISS
jgi:hypothetical protein